MRRLYGIDPGLYAIVESATFVDQEMEDSESELFVPIVKEVLKNEEDDGMISIYYLANVDSFHKPVVVIPDVGGPPDAYFMVKPRATWREDFTKWLDMKHETFPNFDENDPENEGTGGEMTVERPQS